MTDYEYRYVATGKNGHSFYSKIYASIVEVEKAMSEDQRFIDRWCARGGSVALERRPIAQWDTVSLKRGIQ